VNAKKRIVTAIASALISLTLVLPAIAGVQLLPLERTAPDGVLGAINPPPRVSDSPWLQLPEELADVPPMQPSAPATGVRPEDDDPLVIEMYDVSSGETVRLRSEQPAYPTSEPYQDYASAFPGLLPAGVAGLDSVLPPDDRVQISPTTSYPWRTVAKLIMSFPDGEMGGCSGAIIGCPNGHGYHALTAGHCVYSHDHGGWATSVKAIPGLDGAYMPYNYAWATQLRSYAGWTVNGETEHDWALVTLDRNVGDFTGWMGRRTCNPPGGCPEYTGTLKTAGYPADKGGEAMWFDSDTGHSVNEYNHWYYMDTAGGQSGSPVWLYETSSDSRHILTIHTSGIDSTGCNHGTRLDQDKYDRIVAWCDLDSSPADRADLIDDGQTWSGFSPAMVKPGTTILQAWNGVRNVGTASSGGFYVSYYASTNTTISTADYLIGSAYVASISPFSWADSNWSGTFPGGVPDGLYHVGWIIDSTGQVVEFDEANNTAYKETFQVLVDGTPPTNPTSATETGGAPNDSWQNAVGDPAFSWSDASDGTGSGIAGYYAYWGMDPSGTSGTWTASAGYDPGAVPSPSTYYLRVQAKDIAGNTGDWATLFTFRYDASPPSNPSSLTSPSHTVGTWCKDTSIDVSWSGASDGGGSGVHGYSYDWSTSPGHVPDITVDTTASGATSPGLPDGEDWYFHVRTRDNAGNWNTEAVHSGPYLLDSTAPACAVLPLSAVQDAPFFAVAWSGNDADPGSGIESYDVQYRVGSGGAWSDWIVGTPATAATFGPADPVLVEREQTYYFRCRARDTAQNLGAYAAGDGDTWTWIANYKVFLPLIHR
jgi:V8-like Glu-specific endopeptidase